MAIVPRALIVYAVAKFRRTRIYISVVIVAVVSSASLIQVRISVIIPRNREADSAGTSIPQGTKIAVIAWICVVCINTDRVYARLICARVQIVTVLDQLARDRWLPRILPPEKHCGQEDNSNPDRNQISAKHESPRSSDDTPRR
jgi:hypothetical protein